MAKVADKLDAIEARVMKGLKDFQRATVERIDWLYRHGQRRVLVSDEVGLGKTLVARGVVAKMAKLRRDEGDELVKVVYVCSNAAIARQNLEKLQITSEAQTDDVSSSRLSMQHLRVFRQENDPELHEKYIQLIPLTPDTSFNVTSGAGRVDERALMFVHLRRLPELKPYLRQFKIIIQGRAKAAWDDRLNKYKEEAEKCNEESKGCYFTYMEQKLRQELRQVENGNIMDSIIALCQSRRRTDDAMEGEKKGLYSNSSG